MINDRRIIGLLSWWDESPTWLAATVASMARVCDHIVALDGRYALYPDERVASAQEQADAIAHAAYGSAVGVTIVQPRELFADEMDKRTQLFRLGEAVADPHRDWFLILDADEVLDPATDRGIVHELINHAEHAGAPVVCGQLRETIDEHCNVARSRASRQFAVENVTLAPTPRLWKVHDRMQVQGYHFHYSGLDQDGQRVVLWNRDGDGPRAPWHHAEELIVETRCLMRSESRLQGRKEYYAERDRLKVEQVNMKHAIQGAA